MPGDHLLQVVHALHVDRRTLGGARQIRPKVGSSPTSAAGGLCVASKRSVMMSYATEPTASASARAASSFGRSSGSAPRLISKDVEPGPHRGKDVINLSAVPS